jgi:hypothetical protein
VNHVCQLISDKSTKDLTKLFYSAYVPSSYIEWSYAMDDNFLWPEKKDELPRLFNLLSAHVAADLKTKNGVLDVRAFADRLGRSSEGVYKWLRKDSFPANARDLITKVCPSLTKRILSQYVNNV